MELAPELAKSGHLYSWSILGLVTMSLVLISYIRDPLLKVPGPWYSKWTDLVMTYQSLIGRKPAYIHDLHLKYGPIVRVGPREVYVTDPEAIRGIYGVKNEFHKSKFYVDFNPYGRSVFTTTDVIQHKRFKRLLSSPLSETGLKKYLPQIDDKVHLVIQKMKEESQTRGVIDIYKWWVFFSTDVIGELSFGESFKMLESGKINQYIADLQSAGKMGSWRVAFPRIMAYSIRLNIPIPRLKATREMAVRIRKFAREALQRHRDLVDGDASHVDSTLFSKLYKAEGEESINPNEVLDNAQAYIVAGSDTTSNTLTYLVWAVCSNPEIQSRLVKELGALPENFTHDDLRQISYLEWVIDETLRRFPTVPGGLPREVPAGGAHIGGYHIPAGYTVATQNYSLHRNANAYPDPEKFDPSRWEHPTQAMKDSFLAFGAGSRICIGLNLARIELRLSVARFFKAFPNAKVSKREGMRDEDMNPELFFLTSPQGKRCLIEAS
ncbi:cytochrome P450 [Xylaria nigripes]|nr:cytochrome P450 [Xylaria nigripes]